MSAILFAPHNDDETLFAFYQLIRLNPRVITVLRSFRQWIDQNGPSYETREAETFEALSCAGIDKWEQWQFSDRAPDWDAIADRIDTQLRLHQPQHVIFPAWEMGGHEDHNALSSVIRGIRGDWQRIEYLTYVRGYGRSQSPNVIKATRDEEEAKTRALLCYDSQINHPATRDWFPGGEYHTLTEWVL